MVKGITEREFDVSLQYQTPFCLFDIEGTPFPAKLHLLSVSGCMLTGDPPLTDTHVKVFRERIV